MVTCVVVHELVGTWDLDLEMEPALNFWPVTHPGPEVFDPASPIRLHTELKHLVGSSKLCSAAQIPDDKTLALTRDSASQNYWPDDPWSGHSVSTLVRLSIVSLSRHDSKQVRKQVPLSPGSAT